MKILALTRIDRPENIQTNQTVIRTVFLAPKFKKKTLSKS
jgi:hypothetical protein